jgi:hypothetical protein
VRIVFSLFSAPLKNFHSRALRLSCQTHGATKQPFFFAFLASTFPQNTVFALPHRHRRSHFDVIQHHMIYVINFLLFICVASDAAPTAVELKSKVKPVSNIRFSSSAGSNFLIFNQNNVQSFRISSKGDSVRSVLSAEVRGFGILLAKQTASAVVVVSDSGAKVSKWDLGKDAPSEPVVRSFENKIVSAIHVADDFITVGHPQGALDLLDAKTLDTVCSYTCFPHPDELIKEPVSAVGDRSLKSKNIHKTLEALVTSIDRFGNYIIASTDSGTCHFIASPLSI